MVSFLIDGAQEVKKTDNGDLEIIPPSGFSIIQKRPTIYQVINDVRINVEGSFELTKQNGKYLCTFNIGNYDKNYALVIDPIFLSYSTYLGGGGDYYDVGLGIAVDTQGNVYVTGWTWSADFPIKDAFQGSHGGGYGDAFVTKLARESNIYISPSLTSGIYPLTVEFRAFTSLIAKEYHWDFDNDGVIDAVTTGSKVVHTYTAKGNYTATVTVKDYRGNSFTSSPVTITVAEPLSLPEEVTFVPYYPESDFINSRVMKGGMAVRYYRIVDRNNIPVKNTRFQYKYRGYDIVKNAITDDEGFTALETHWLSSDVCLMVDILREDGTVNTSVRRAPEFCVDVLDREFHQEWTLLVGGKLSTGVGGPSLKIGPVRFKTVEFGIEGGRSAKVILDYGSDGTVTFSNEIATTSQIGASHGLFNRTWHVKTVPSIEVGFEGCVNALARYGSSFKFPGFFESTIYDHDAQTLASAGFFLETVVASLPQMPVGLDTVMSWVKNKIEEKMNLGKYKHSLLFEVGVGGYFNGGASLTLKNPFGFSAGSSLEINLMDFNGEIVFGRRSEERTNGTVTDRLEITHELDVSALKLNMGKKFGGDRRRKDTPKFNLDGLFSKSVRNIKGTKSLEVERDTQGNVSTIALKHNISRDSEEYLFNSDTVEDSLVIKVMGSNIIDLMKQISDEFKNMVEGGSTIITPGSFDSAYNAVFDASTTPQEWYCEREEKSLHTIPFDFELGSGIKLGLGVNIEAMRSIKYKERAGIVSLSKGMIEVERYKKDSHITINQKEIGDFFHVFGEALKSAVSGMFYTVSNAIKDTVKTAGAQIKGSMEGIRGFITRLGPQKKTYSIYALTYPVPEGVRVPQEAVLQATTIGDVYIINLKDADGNDLTDFSANPVELSIDYTDELLQAAGIDISKAAKLAIYRWDGSTGYYINHKSEVDTVNKNVKANITKPGQYILAIDEIPPVVADFGVSDHTATPTFTARITDAFSGVDTSSFSFRLDNTVVLDGEDLASYYDPQSGMFKYYVSSPLAKGSHTAEIYVKDTAGNPVNPSVIQFTVNDVPPIINHEPITEAQSGSDLTVSASITDDTGIKRATLFFRPEIGEFPYMSLPMRKSEGNIYTGVIPSQYMTSLNIRYYIAAEDMDGNVATMSEPVVIRITDTTPLENLWVLQSLP